MKPNVDLSPPDTAEIHEPVVHAGVDFVKVDRAKDVAGSSGFDFVLVTAPAESAVNMVIDLVRPRGRLVQIVLLGRTRPSRLTPLSATR